MYNNLSNEEIRKQQQEYKKCMEKILGFLHQIKQHTDSENYYIPWFTTKDYKLFHFQAYIWKMIDEFDLQILCNKRNNKNNKDNNKDNNDTKK